MPLCRQKSRLPSPFTIYVNISHIAIVHLDIVELLIAFLSQYSRVAHYNTTHLRRQSFYALPQAHWELLAAPPFSYLDTLNAVDDAIDSNAELATAILRSGLESFGLFLPQEGHEEPLWRNT